MSVFITLFTISLNAILAENFILVKFLVTPSLSGLEEFVPEESLQTVEVKSALS